VRQRLALLIITCCLIAPGAFAADQHPGVGDAAPDFTARNLLTRDKVTLSQEQGKLVFLTFWASWCGPCRKEVPVLEAVQRKLGKERVAVLAVSFRDNNEQQLVKWARDNGLQLMLLSDWNGHIASQYGVHAIPHLYIIGRDGRILHVHTGYGPGSIDQLVREINTALADSGAGMIAAPPAGNTAQ
jgi:peroxiredoxin